MEFSNIPYSLVRKDSQPVLYVVRHGATGDDDSYNSPENPHLNEEGWKDAQAAAEFLADKKVGPIITSGFYRTEETAQEIAKHIGKPVIIADGLDSWRVGDVKHMKSSEDADRVIQHHVDNPHKPIPGGESLNSLRGRVDPVLEEGVKDGVATGNPPVMIAHHSIQHEVGRLFNGDHESALTKTGGIVAVYMTPTGLRAISIFRPEKV